MWEEAYREKLITSDVGTNEDDIATEEVLYAIEKLRKGKAPGPD